MKPFIDDDFLLGSKTARCLFHEHAAKMPIVDFHSHVSPREIAENRRYDTISQLWLQGDHYKWRLMRWCGISEEYITGGATDKEKFDAFAAALPRAIGNPVYHWAHLELRRYFDCDLVLGPDTADEVWHICNAKLVGGFSAREIIRMANVRALCTTDDPADDLRWHRALANEPDFSVQVLPTFRPDKALNIHKPGFAGYLQELEQVCGKPIQTFAMLCSVLDDRLTYFCHQGCRIADHGLDEIPWNKDVEKAEELFQRAAAGEVLSFAEAEAYQTALLLFLAQKYAERGMVMQIHYGVQRNPNPVAFERLGPDTGFDCIDTPNNARKLGTLLGEMNRRSSLPKTVLYSLNPADDKMLASVAGSFQGTGVPGRVQHGSAWWFNDTLRGIRTQLETLADTGVLGSFIGMLTDSRSFTSYARHEYFRRILCDLIGGWVESGQYPADMPTLGKLAEDISYNNVVRFLDLDL